MKTADEHRKDSLGPGRRFAWAALAWALVALAQPGLGRPGGFGHLAFVALVPWALACSRPGRRAFLAEWAAAALGLIAMSYWMRHLLPGLVPFLGLVPGVWVALAGVLLRRLARRFPLAFAAPVAWFFGEWLRWNIDAPFSFGWWRLGLMAHDTGWLAGSARVFGVWGLSYVFAAFGGWVADWRIASRSEDAVQSRASHLCGLGPLFIAVVTSLLPAPETVDGPRVLLVQPGYEQERKSFSQHPLDDLLAPTLALTFEGIEAARAAGEAAPDLVAWGESALVASTLEAGLEEAWAAGLRTPQWSGRDVDADWMRRTRGFGAAIVQGVLLGRQSADDGLLRGMLLRAGEAPWAHAVLEGRPLLPAGTSFASGAEYHLAYEGELRRQNAVFLWNPEGARSGPAPKIHLVPAAEDMRGLQVVSFARGMMNRVGGYIPDFVPGDETRVLPLRTRDGRSFSVGATVCYDNVFDDPYTVPLRRDALDFHLIVSNEAWYQESVEMDHMVAFSRLVAIMTGRSVVRATNSGISIVLDPDGRDVAAVERGGERKMVSGTCLATVPVPVDPAGKTLYVRTERLQMVLWWALIVLAWWMSRVQTVTSGGASSSPEASESSRVGGA